MGVPLCLFLWKILCGLQWRMRMYTIVASLNKTIVWIKSPPFERQRQQNWLRVKADWHIHGVPGQPGLLSIVAIGAELPVTENAEKSLGPLSELHPARHPHNCVLPCLCLLSSPFIFLSNCHLPNISTRLFLRATSF